MSKAELLEQIEITKKYVQQAVDYVDFCESVYDFPEQCFGAYHSLAIWTNRLNNLKRKLENFNCCRKW